MHLIVVYGERDLAIDLEHGRVKEHGTTEVLAVLTMPEMDVIRTVIGMVNIPNRLRSVVARSILMETELGVGT
jgi:hypothetical protein